MKLNYLLIILIFDHHVFLFNISKLYMFHVLSNHLFRITLYHLTINFSHFLNGAYVHLSSCVQTILVSFFSHIVHNKGYLYIEAGYN